MLRARWRTIHSAAVDPAARSHGDRRPDRHSPPLSSPPPRRCSRQSAAADCSTRRRGRAGQARHAGRRRTRRPAALMRSGEFIGRGLSGRAPRRQYSSPCRPSRSSRRRSATRSSTRRFRRWHVGGPPRRSAPPAATSCLPGRRASRARRSSIRPATPVYVHSVTFPARTDAGRHALRAGRQAASRPSSRRCRKTTVSD